MNGINTACPLSSVTLWWKVFGMSPCEIAYNVMVVTNAVGFEFCSSINLTNMGTIISGKNFGLRQIHIPFISCLTLNCFLPSVRSLRFLLELLSLHTILQKSENKCRRPPMMLFVTPAQCAHRQAQCRPNLIIIYKQIWFDDMFIGRWHLKPVLRKFGGLDFVPG